MVIFLFMEAKTQDSGRAVMYVLQSCGRTVKQSCNVLKFCKLSIKELAKSRVALLSEFGFAGLYFPDKLGQAIHVRPTARSSTCGHAVTSSLSLLVSSSSSLSLIAPRAPCRVRFIKTMSCIQVISIRLRV